MFTHWITSIISRQTSPSTRLIGISVCLAASVNAAEQPSPPQLSPFCGIATTNAPDPLQRSVKASTFSLSADSMFSQTTDISAINGNVILISGDATIKTDSITLNNKTNDFSAKDPINITNPSASFTAKAITGNTVTNQLTLSEANFQLKLSGANGQAKSIKVINDNQTQLSELSFSSCRPNDNSWRFFADSLKIDQQEGWAYADDLVLKIADVPIFYFPLLMFPVDDQRHTGVLPPSYRDTARNGLEFSLPIYLNIDQQYDATITPTYFEQRGTQLASELRYMYQQAEGEVWFANLDDKTRTTNSNRWSYLTSHRGQLGQYWRYSLNAAGVSDTLYFQDLGNTISAGNQQYLARRANVGFYSPQLQASVNWLQFQPLTLNLEPYRQLPQFNLNWQPLAADNPLQLELFSQYSEFENPDQLANNYRRRVTQLIASYRYDNGWSFVVPQVMRHQSSYQEQL
ncbi:MAG: LPS assembly protein LptD, partial [Kangiellaceae bacterium]|nr:LPS assembly protein LptD [Kangiellaceae bacterium]